jgi:hypothetical protein
LKRPYVACFSLGFAFFLAATLLCDVIARVAIGGEGVGHAIARHAFYAVTEHFGTGMLLVPFLLVTWMSAALAQRKSLRRGLLFLCVTGSILTVMYLLGYLASQQFMAQRMWTAATLAIGFLFFKSIPVVIAALVAFLILRRKARAEA